MADFTKLNGYTVKDPNAVHTYDTVADLKADTKLKAGNHVQTKGYTTAGDDGHASYIIVDDNTLVDDGGSVHDLANGLKAVLMIKDNINIKQFGVSGNEEDNTLAFQNAINYAISHNYKLILNSNINISSVKTDLITINGNIQIDGNGNTLFNNVIGDYHSLFLITGKVSIKNLIITNNENNEPTEDTGTVDSEDRVDFYLRECTDSTFENITINNCLGVWQFICVRCQNTKINNNTINYNEAYTVDYDRTSMYLHGLNIQCENNILNGKDKARTAIESHGDNILIRNNRIIGYRSPIYIVNDESPLYDEIHQINVIGNYCYTQRGICVWLEGEEDVDTINILNNTIITTGDWYALYTYDVLSENFTVKNINVKNNIIKQLGTTTKETFRFSPTQVGSGKNVNIESINITNNDITEAGTGYTFEMYNQLDGVTIKNIFVKDNIFNLNNNTFSHYVSTAGRINNVYFLNNDLRNNGALLLSISTATKNGEIRFHDNTVEKSITAIGGGNININTSVKGTFPIDLKVADVKDFYYIDIKDLTGNSVKTNGSVNNYTIYNDSVLTGVQFKKGDIIINTNPVIGTPFGWISIGNDNFRIIQNILGGV